MTQFFGALRSRLATSCRVVDGSRSYEDLRGAPVALELDGRPLRVIGLREVATEKLFCGFTARHACCEATRHVPMDAACCGPRMSRRLRTDAAE
jgi:hypothetical protein